MSKLDYVTIAIVAVCIAAIIFLIVKIAGLSDNRADLEPNSIENTLGPTAADEEALPAEGSDAGDADYSTPESAYNEDPDDDEVEYFDPVEEEGRFADQPAAASSPASPPPASREKEKAATSASEELTPRGGTSTTASRGRFMVIAGSFRYKHNAQQMVRQLKKLGYDQAGIGYTNNGAYAVALVKRFDNEASAKRLVEELESRHQIDAIVKTEE